jgi:hypothetical protein
MISRYSASPNNTKTENGYAIFCFGIIGFAF